MYRVLTSRIHEHRARNLPLFAPMLILCLALPPAVLAQAEDAGDLASTREAAEAHHRAGETAKAVEAWRSLINRSEDDSTLAVAYNELGYWLLAHDDETKTLKHAEACFLEALKLSGGRANRARLNLAEVLHRQGDEEASGDVLDSFVHPELAKPWRSLRRIELSPPVAERAAELRAKAAESASPGALHAEGDVEPPEAIRTPNPTYTREAHDARIQGVVILQTLIDEGGDVVSVEVLKPLVMGLTEKAVEAIKRWKFEPATLDGEPVAVYYNLTVNFRLDNSKDPSDIPPSFGAR